MTITREQVADLQPGDVVELRLTSGTAIRGPLKDERGYLGIAGAGWNVRSPGGGLAFHIDDGASDLTVVSRAPRPFYVNHPRTEPVPGDVVRCAEHEDCVETWSYAPIQAAPDSPWQSTRHAGRASWDDLFDRTLLLVDGETGQVVP